MNKFTHLLGFVIGDPTEMPRPHAKETEYIGILSDLSELENNLLTK